MALIHCDFFSRTLELSMSMCVVLPEPRTPTPDPLPTLWLLHGLSDDHTIWQRRTGIERYVHGMGLAVVMPAVHRSYYTNMGEGLRYWDFNSEELPALARGMFPLSARRADNFVAGLSMGGYGAFKLALRQPERFAAAASLSGVLDIAAYSKHWEGEVLRERERIFGPRESIAGSDNDLVSVAQALMDRGATPPALFQCCGTEDFLYANNVLFRDKLTAMGFDVHYEEGPGDHEWEYWDRQIQRVLAWLPIRPKEPRP